METPPTFFYNPNAYEIGIIRPENIVCKCCGQQRAFSYQGGLHSSLHRHNETHPLCPWCIANGKAATRFNGDFVADFDNIDPDPRNESRPISAASLEQVSRRTPGYISFQGQQWLTHCGEACVFLGYVGSADLQPVWEEVLPDIIANDWGEEQIRQHLSKDGDVAGYLFQCPRCGKHRLHVDAS